MFLLLKYVDVLSYLCDDKKWSNYDKNNVEKQQN